MSPSSKATTTNKYLSTIVIAIFFNVAIFSIANSQGCQSQVYVSGWNSFSNYYTACDRWLKATMEFDVGENNGMAEFLANVDNTPYYREFDIGDYPEDGHYSEVDLHYCNTLTSHQAGISTYTGPPPGEEQETWRGFTNPELTVNYYASKPD